MKIKRWYWIVVAVWAVTGLPIYVVGQGFLGPEHGAFTLSAFLRSLVPPVSNAEFFITWLMVTILIFLPLLFLPFALTTKRKSRATDRGGTG